MSGHQFVSRAKHFFCRPLESLTVTG